MFCFTLLPNVVFYEFIRPFIFGGKQNSLCDRKFAPKTMSAHYRRCLFN